MGLSGDVSDHFYAQRRLDFWVDKSDAVGETFAMPDFASRLGASRSESTLLVLYIPSADRNGKALAKKEQGRWVRKSLEVLGRHMSGATAFPRGLGIWRDDARGGKLVWDRPVLVQCYTNEATIIEKSLPLRDFLVDMGEQTNQGAVAFVIDHDFYLIEFPL